MSSPPFSPYDLIVGAGPSGLLLALLLGLRNIPTLVVDSNASIDQQPRATHYGMPAVQVLRRAGVLDDVLDQGFHMRHVSWRKLNGEFLAGINLDDLDGVKGGEDRIAVLPLQKLGAIILRHIEEKCQGVVEVRWGCKVTNVEQDDDKAWVTIEPPSTSNNPSTSSPTNPQPTTISSQYIIGCDGANSIIRRTLFSFSPNPFPGTTWPVQVVATNTYYDFDRFHWHDSNFIIHPEHWYMAARIGKDGMWRVSYGEKAGLSREELLARQPAKFETMLPGNPKPDEYRITNFSPYKVHQRLAEKMRVGRILLAADAAHLCNPFGGMGLTGGIADVGGLAQCLISIYEGKADESILDVYDEVRRKKYKEIVDPISSQNIRRLYDQDPEQALEKDGFLQFLRKAEGDKELSREMQLKSLELEYDFSRHYRDGDFYGGGKCGRANGEETNGRVETKENEKVAVDKMVALVD